MNKGIYPDLVIACQGEALQLIIDTPEGDGWGAFKSLREAYGNASANSQFMVIKALIDLKQKGAIREHVNAFKQLLRRLNDMKITLVDSVVSVMFLRSLTSQYKQFATNAMLNGNMTAEKLCTAACEYSKAHLASSDEAKSKDLAMSVRTCPQGHGCTNWRNGNCQKFHPAPPANGNKRGTKRKASEEEKGKSTGEHWACPKCQFYNYSHRDKCLQCSANKPRKVNQPGLKWYRARLAELSEKSHGQNEKYKMLGYGDDQLSDDGEPVDRADVAHIVGPTEIALATREKKIMRFTVDSGASSHFVNTTVPLRDTVAQTTSVQTAGGKMYKIREAGQCRGTASNGNEVTFEAKRCIAFGQNLYSVFEAARNGTRTVFDWDHSYLENKTTGEKTPLVRRSHGWTLDLKKPSAHSA